MKSMKLYKNEFLGPNISNKYSLRHFLCGQLQVCTCNTKCTDTECQFDQKVTLLLKEFTVT